MIRDFLIYFPASLLPRLAAFFTVLAGARLLEPEQFGYFSLVALVGEFAELMTASWVRIALSRFGAWNAGLSRAFATRMGGLALVCALVAIAFSAGITSLLAPEMAVSVAFAVAAYILAAAFARYGVALNQAMGYRKRASFLESVRAVLAFLAALGLMASAGDFLSSSLAASAVNLVVGVVAVSLGFKASKRTLPDQTPLKQILSFALPLIVLAALSQTITNLDKALLKAGHDAATLGFYAAAFAVGRSGFDAIANAFNTGTFVRLSALFNEGEIAEARDLLQRQMAYLLSLALPCAGILIASRDLIAEVFFPPAYFETFVTAIPVVALGAIALNLKHSVYDNIFHMHLRNFLQIPTLIVGACVTGGLGLWLLPDDPVLGAATMFAGGSVAALLTSAILSSSLLRIALPWRAIFVAVLLGGVAFGAGQGIKKLLTDSLSATVLLGLLSIAGALVAGVSLFGCYVLCSPRGEKIAIAFISIIPDRLTGLSSYAESLCEAMARRQDRPPLVFFTNASPAIFSRLAGHEALEWVTIPDRPHWLPYRLYSLIQHNLASLHAMQKGCRVYLSTTADGALFPVIDQTMTLHDLYDIDRRYRPWRTVFSAGVLWRLIPRVSRRVICVSDTTCNEARSSLPVAGEKFHVIKEASKFPSEEAAVPSDEAHFLFVANVYVTKNSECILEALRRANHDGSPVHVDWIGWDAAGIINRWTALHGQIPGFSMLGSLPDADLRQAYRQAVALIVPSWKEGFCLPVLEAHAFGCPVIASDIPVLREVAGKGALFFDPSDPDTLLAAMRKLLSDPLLRQSLSELSAANARLYSWDKAAAETYQLLESV